MEPTIVAIASVVYCTLFALSVALFVWPSFVFPPGCPVPLCSTYRLRRVEAGEEREGGPRWERHDASHLYRSYLCGGSGGIVGLLSLRVLFVVVYIVITTMQFEGPQPLFTGGSRDWMTYFTNWTFTLFCLHGLLGSFISTRGLVRESGPPASQPPLSQFDAIDKVFSVVVCTVTPASSFLTAFYWVALYQGQYVTVDNVARHGGSAALLLLEVFVGRVPMTSSWVLFPTAYTYIYLAFMWVNFAASRIWVYNALAFENAGSLTYYLLLPWGVLLFFAFTFLLTKLRETVLSARDDRLHPQHEPHPHDASGKVPV